MGGKMYSKVFLVKKTQRSIRNIFSLKIQYGVGFPLVRLTVGTVKTLFICYLGTNE